MKTDRIKFLVYAAAAVLVAGFAGYTWAKWTHEPPLVEITRTACGVPTTTASFRLPLQTALEAGQNAPLALGPVDMPDGGGLITLRFDPSVDGRGREVRMLDDVLYLPTAFGRGAELPQRITITCRDGMPASIRYQGDRRNAMTYTVLREQTAAVVASEPAEVAAD